ncbi:unnamed protein product [Caenorhabditis sp. 36 PRJEB53466]|nr:unnamed protein product [Caenorhabditis sp. 36 PRJEB53466]
MRTGVFRITAACLKQKMVKPKKEKVAVNKGVPMKDNDKKAAESAIFADSEGRIGLRIHAKPGAKKSCVVAIGESEVDVAIGAAPREGAANEELISYLMSALGLRKNEIQFDKGAKSRSKVVLIETERLTMDDVKKRLQSEIVG